MINALGWESSGSPVQDLRWRIPIEVSVHENQSQRFKEEQKKHKIRSVTGGLNLPEDEDALRCLRSYMAPQAALVSFCNL